ncbi:MAG TPA: hypothetical protein VFX59_15680 [Polyangiales bacterium]|nr:hypothetical protein [Polyangiales bacterium]
MLRTSLASALEGACIPDWEFDALIGCSRARARRSFEAGVRRLETRGELPGETTCERMVVLLSALLGASRGSGELERLVARLGVQERSALESGVALREDLVAPAQAQRR